MEVNLNLERECPYCVADDYSTYMPAFRVRRNKCMTCKGTGIIPTELGKEVLTFVEKYMKTATNCKLEIIDEQWRKY